MRTFTSSLLAAACSAGVLLAQTHYAVVDLGTLGGTNSQALGINNHGVIVGSAMLPNGDSHAFAYMGGMMTDLGTLGGTNSQAYSINDGGLVVGMADLTNGMHHGFLATNGMAGYMMSDLGTLGGTNSVAYCINLMSNITGQAELPSGLSHAAMWTNMVSGMMDVDAGDAGSSAGYGMNGANQIVGFAHFSGTMRGFMTGAGMMGGGMTSMGTLGGVSSVANSVNDQGAAAGSSMMPNGSQHAYSSAPGGMGGMGGMALNDLGTLGGTNSEAFCLNAGGTIVGMAETTNGTSHAFMYGGGMMHDLNDLISTNSGWVLTEAHGINNHGQIVGSGIVGDQMHGFLLTPVSAPVQLGAMPTNLVLGPGAMMQMSIAMNTGDALGYQWMFNGTNLVGQTNATLVLPDMGSMMAGRYNVVVSNSVGMVANLSASVAMLMMQKTAQSGPSLSLYGPMNGHYQIDQAPVLGTPTMWTMMTNLFLTTNAFSHVVAPGGTPMHFYRAVPQP